MNFTQVMTANTMWATVTRSLPRAPISRSRPYAPPDVQPMAQRILKRIMATPRTEERTGKQTPATTRKVILAPIHSTKFMWALCPLFSKYHCSQLRLREQKPEPVSGYPPFLISCPVTLLCSAPKFSFRYSSVKTFVLTPPAKMNPIDRQVSPISTAVSITHPNSCGRISTKPSDIVRYQLNQFIIKACVKLDKKILNKLVINFLEFRQNVNDQKFRILTKRGNLKNWVKFYSFLGHQRIIFNKISSKNYLMSICALSCTWHMISRKHLNLQNY